MPRLAAHALLEVGKARVALQHVHVDDHVEVLGHIVLVLVLVLIVVWLL